MGKPTRSKEYEIEMDLREMQDGMAHTVLVYFRTRTGGGFCGHGNELSGFIK